MLGNTNKVASTRRKGEQGAGETDQWRDQDLGHTGRTRQALKKKKKILVM